MENRESYKMRVKHPETYRKLNVDQEKQLRQFATVKYCAEKEIDLERGGIAKHLCFIYTGYALGYEREYEEPKLSRIWQPSQIILKADSLLAFQRSKMDIVFAEGGHIIEIPFDYKGIFGDNINIMLAAAAFNFKSMMNKWKKYLLLVFQNFIYNGVSIINSRLPKINNAF